MSLFSKIALVMGLNINGIVMEIDFLFHKKHKMFKSLCDKNKLASYYSMTFNLSKVRIVKLNTKATIFTLILHDQLKCFRKTNCS